jgi:hypothetical protein
MHEIESLRKIVVVQLPGTLPGLGKQRLPQIVPAAQAVGRREINGGKGALRCLARSLFVPFRLGDDRSRCCRVVKSNRFADKTRPPEEPDFQST